MKMYCRVAQQPHINKMAMQGYTNVRYYKSKPLGRNSITELFKEGAMILGLSDPENFRPQSLRGACITRMVNAENVSMAETMRYARHRSVAASKTYQRTDGVSESNRLQAIGVKIPTRRSDEIPKKVEKCKEEEDDMEFVDLQAGYNPRDKASTGPTVRRMLEVEDEKIRNAQRKEELEQQESYYWKQEEEDDDRSTDSTIDLVFKSEEAEEGGGYEEPRLGLLTQVGIEKLKGKMEVLKKEIVIANTTTSTARRIKQEETTAYATKNPPQSTNSRIVKDLITQVEELRRNLKKKTDEELVYQSRENDSDNRILEFQREKYEMELQINALKLENEEMFFSIARSDGRLERAERRFERLEAAENRRSSRSSAVGRGGGNRSDEEEDDVFAIRRSRKRRR